AIPVRWRVRESSLRRFRAGGREQLQADRDRTCRRPARRADPYVEGCSCARFFHLRFGGFDLNERVEGMNGLYRFIQESDGIMSTVSRIKHGYHSLPDATNSAKSVINGACLIAAMDHAVSPLGIAGFSAVILPFC